jgi:flagellar hook-associated protein 1 FlgK
VDVSWDDGMLFQPISGELAGLIEARDVVIVEQKQQLDNLASELMTQVNSIHQTGYGLNESIVYDSANTPLGAFRDFFVASDPVNNPALSLRVNADLEDLSQISLSLIDVPAGAVDGDVLSAASGDGRVAEQLFNLRNTAVTFADGKVDTLNHYNTMRVGDLGLTIKRVTTLSSQHNNLLTVLNEQRESVGGVNLDEEAAKLLKFQRSYQAAVRLMTAVDEMMEQIVTRLGLVGR